MKTLLLSALPNSLLVPQEGRKIVITSLTTEDAIAYLKSHDWKSCVGHDSTADVFTKQLGIPIKANREQIQFQVGDTIIAGLFTPTRRLPEGEKWTESEILTMPVNWLLLSHT